MKSFTSTIFAILILSGLATAQQKVTLDMAKTFGSGSRDNVLSSVADAAGNIYLAGFFKDSTDLNPGPTLQKFMSKGGNDAFIIKLDRQGNLLWSRVYASSQDEIIVSIALDNSGNLYAAGEAGADVDFDPGPGVSKLDARGVFLLKLSPEGVFDWVRTVVANGQASGLAIDVNDDVAVMGRYLSNNSDFNPGPATFLMSPKGSGDIFISKFNDMGTFLWAWSFGGADFEFPKKILFQGSHIYFSGTFIGNVDFDPGNGNTNTVASGNDDIFVCKITNSGAFVWVKTIGSNSASAVSEILYDMKADKDENVYLGGSFANELDFDPGNGTHTLKPSKVSNGFLLKLDKDGNFKWVAPYVDNSNGTRVTQIYIYSKDTIYVGGFFVNDVDLDPTQGQRVLQGGPFGGFVSIISDKMQFKGGFIFGRNIVLAGIHPAKNGEILLTGHFGFSFDADIDTGELIVKSLGDDDGFVFRYILQKEQSSTGLNHYKIGNVSLYPNPTNGGVTVTIPEKYDDGVIRIWNSAGSNCFEQKLTGEREIFVEIPPSPGLYVVEVIMDSNCRSISKVMRQ